MIEPSSLTFSTKATWPYNALAPDWPASNTTAVWFLGVVLTLYPASSALLSQLCASPQWPPTCLSNCWTRSYTYQVHWSYGYGEATSEIENGLNALPETSVPLLPVDVEYLSKSGMCFLSKSVKL